VGKEKRGRDYVKGVAVKQRPLRYHSCKGATDACFKMAIYEPPLQSEHRQVVSDDQDIVGRSRLHGTGRDIGRKRRTSN